jgi:rubrerythrin
MLVGGVWAALSLAHIKHQFNLRFSLYIRGAIASESTIGTNIKSRQLQEILFILRLKYANGENKIMDFKGSKTEKNLLAAFAGESQARTRYTFFASVAKKEGYEQIAAIFQETADNEKEHAELFFKHLKGGMVEVNAAYPAGVIASTAENLKAAAEGEKLEWGTLYPNFADVAEQEGFSEVARTFRSVAKVEAYHERRYLKLLANVTEGKVFKKDKPIKWKCRNCGFVFEGSEAPEKCPVCGHPRSYFEVWCENY